MKRIETLAACDSDWSMDSSLSVVDIDDYEEVLECSDNRAPGSINSLLSRLLSFLVHILF